MQIPAQIHHLVALIGIESGLLGCSRAMDYVSHTHPAQDTGGMTVKLFCQLTGFAASSNQLDHLLSKLRR